MSLKQNLHQLLKDIEATCQQTQRSREEIFLVVISKNKSCEEMREAYHEGCRDFGESRVLEALKKMDEMPSDIRWHFVGKLQTNKVNKVIGRFSLIHSVDSIYLAEKISKLSKNYGVKTSILLEVNISGEKTKSGLKREEWKEKFSYLLSLEGIRIQGLMTMAPLICDESIIRQTFSQLRYFRDELSKEAKIDLDMLSMGMSHDYRIAIEEGATLLRIGTKIFSPS